MFNLSQKNTVEILIPKCDYFSCIPPSLNFVKGQDNQLSNNIPREDSAISSKESYLDLNFNVTHRARHGTNADDEFITLVLLFPIALFNRKGLTSSS